MEELFSWEFWDKQTAICGFNSEYWFSNNFNLKNAEEVIIVYNCGVVSEVSSIEVIRTMLGMNTSYSNEDVAKKYIYNLNNNMNQEPEQVKEWKAKELELSQAKFILMKEGLL